METICETDKFSFTASEPYMNKEQLDYFKNKLTLQKMELLEKIVNKKRQLRILGGNKQPDILDKSNSNFQIEQDIRSCERSRKIIQQIDEALGRIEDGSFGYCKVTGMEIGLKRLEIMPFATMSTKAVQEIEHRRNAYPVLN